jgi:hydrogenase maturation protease
MTSRVLVAGVGNVFLSDDGFGVEVVNRLAARALPTDVELVDVGLRARDLAYRLLDGYRALVLVDATQQGQPPGTLYTLEHDLDAAVASSGPAAPVGHETDPDAVLALLVSMAAAMGVPRPVERVIVVGCEPAALGEAIGLSPPVAAAVDRAVDIVAEIATALVDPALLDPALLDPALLNSALLDPERSAHVPGNPR